MNDHPSTRPWALTSEFKMAAIVPETASILDSDFEGTLGARFPDCLHLYSLRNLHRVSTTAPLFSKLKIVDIYQINTFQITKFMHCYHNNLLPPLFFSLVLIYRIKTPALFWTYKRNLQHASGLYVSDADRWYSLCHVEYPDEINEAGTQVKGEPCACS